MITIILIVKQTNLEVIILYLFYVFFLTFSKSLLLLSFTGYEATV